MQGFAAAPSRPRPERRASVSGGLASDGRRVTPIWCPDEGVGLEVLVLVVKMDVVDDFWELSSATYFETSYVLRGEQTSLR